MTSQSSSSCHTISNEHFGDNRFRLQTFRTRFGDVVYFVHDAEQLDEYEMHKVVAQESTRDAAIAKAMALV